MNSSEAINTREPHAEELVRPSFRLQDMEGQDLDKISENEQALLRKGPYGVVVDRVDNHFH